MNKKILLSMLMVIISTLTSFGKSDDDPIINLDTFEIVVLPADTTQGEPNVVQAERGSRLDINWISRPKHGYEVDHWVSKKGLTLYNISDDDTIIVYFKKMQMYTITVISNDTTRGIGRTRQTLWSAVQMLTQKLCCQTIHDCPKVVPLHYESE